jgi:hypothetical protein
MEKPDNGMNGRDCAEAVRVCRGRESVQRPLECVEAVRVCRARESV